MPDPTPDQPPYISVLEELRIPDQPSQADITPKETTKEPEPEPEKKPDEPTPTPEPEKKGTRTPVSPEAKDNFKTVTEKWLKAQKEAEETKTALAERQKKIDELERQLTELPQTKETAAKLAAQIQEREEALLKLKQDFDKTREELKAASLQRDPEFVERFVKGRNFQVDQLRSIAGQNEAVATQALKDKNYERLIEIREQLPPHQQYRWDAILRKIEEIDLEKEQALANSDVEWERIQENRRQQALKNHSELLQKHRAIGEQMIGKLRDEVEWFRNDKEIQAVVSEIAEGVAGGKGAEKWGTPEALFSASIQVPLLQRITQSQAKMIEDGRAEKEALAKERDELKQKLDEQDQFIKSRYGGIGQIRQPAAKESNGDWDPDKPIHEQIAVRRN